MEYQKKANIIGRTKEYRNAFFTPATYRSETVAPEIQRTGFLSCISADDSEKLVY